jgi:hypothetical protein
MNARWLDYSREVTRRWSPRLSAPALAGLLLATAPPALAAPQFVAYHGRTSQTHQVFANAYTAQGYRMIALSVCGSPADARYAAVWVKKSGPAWVAKHGIPAGDYQGWFNKLVGQGYRPTLLTATGAGANAIFAFQFENDGKPFFAKHGLSGTQFSVWNQWARNNQFILSCATVYGTAASPTYAAIWVQNTQNLDWWCHFGLSSAEYQKDFDIYGGAGHRLEFVTLSPAHEYLGVWYDVVGGAWVASHGMASDDYQKKFDDLVPPYYPVCVQGREGPGGIRYAAIWEQ